MNSLRFSLLSLLLLTALVGVSLAWIADRRNGGRPNERYLQRMVESAISESVPPEKIEQFLGVQIARFGNWSEAHYRLSDLKPDPAFPQLQFPDFTFQRGDKSNKYALWRIFTGSDAGDREYFIGIYWPIDGGEPYMIRGVWDDPFPL